MASPVTKTQAADAPPAQSPKKVPTMAQPATLGYLLSQEPLVVNGEKSKNPGWNQYCNEKGDATTHTLPSIVLHPPLKHQPSNQPSAPSARSEPVPIACITQGTEPSPYERVKSIDQQIKEILRQMRKIREYRADTSSLSGITRLLSDEEDAHRSLKELYMLKSYWDMKEDDQRLEDAVHSNEQLRERNHNLQGWVHHYRTLATEVHGQNHHQSKMAGDVMTVQKSLFDSLSQHCKSCPRFSMQGSLDEPVVGISGGHLPSKKRKHGSGPHTLQPSYPSRQPEAELPSQQSQPSQQPELQLSSQPEERCLSYTAPQSKSKKV